jgi:deaminated glutathione amidase
MKVALIQMASGPDPYANLLQVDSWVKEAAQGGAELVCFPENVFYRGPRKTEFFDRKDLFLETNEQGLLERNSEFSETLADFIDSWKISVSLGSVLEKNKSGDRPYNSHFLVGNQGVIRTYRKIHLFRYRGQRETYNESADIQGAQQTVCVDLNSFKLGLSICYDLRFPELYRDLVLNEGAQALLVPAAFTAETGRAHWKTLLKARAIENQAFVLASGQWGSHTDSRGQKCFCYGHSMIVDPWGSVLAEASASGDEILWAQLDKKSQNDLRERLPALEDATLNLAR